MAVHLFKFTLTTRTHLLYQYLGSSAVTFDAHRMLPRFIETLSRTFHFVE